MAEITKFAPSMTENQILNGKEESYYKKQADLDDDQNYAYAAQIVDSLTFPMAMHTTIELDLLGIIARAGPPGHQLSALEIAARLSGGSKNPNAASMVDRLLRLLATYSVTTCSVIKGGDQEGSVVRTYGLASVAKYFVPNEDGVSLAPAMLLSHHKHFVDSWCKLKEAVLEGGVAFNKVHGMNVFEYPSVDLEFNDVLNKAMYNQSFYVVKKILERYNGFEEIRRLVDVGGGLGHSLRIITAKYPSIEGINYDLPHVVEHAPPIHGVEHVGGDMFKSVPKGDAILLKSVLHDWSNDCCLALLKNCYKALLDNGKVVVLEANITEEPETTVYGRVNSQMDVLMMTQTLEGKEDIERVSSPCQSSWIYQI